MDQPQVHNGNQIPFLDVNLGLKNWTVVFRDFNAVNEKIRSYGARDFPDYVSQVSVDLYGSNTDQCINTEREALRHLRNPSEPSVFVGFLSKDNSKGSSDVNVPSNFCESSDSPNYSTIFVKSAHGMARLCWDNVTSLAKALEPIGGVSTYFKMPPRTAAEATGAATVAATAGAGAAVVGIPAAVAAAGFGAGGIAAGSTAAGMMSAAAIASGGVVKAGSTVAILQSVGAIGLGTLTLPVAAVGAVFGIASVGTVYGIYGLATKRVKADEQEITNAAKL